MVRLPTLRALASLAFVATIASGCTSPGATPTPSATSAAPSTGPTAAPSLAPGQFEMAVGKAALAAPAADRGRQAATQLNDFGFDLLRHLEPNGNLVASPASIALALAMVRPGAKGPTATEMDKVLHAFGTTGSSSEIAALLQTYAAQTVYIDSNGMAIPSDKRATADPIVELDVADEAFIQRDLPVEPAYLDALHSGFNAGIALVDYKNSTEAARKLINAWASAQTKGRIPEIFPQGSVDAATRLVLVNAIYLKAAWDNEFDPTQTKDRAFTLSSGTAEQVSTMAIDAQFQYGAGSGYKAVTLPYTAGGMAMTIVVPDDMATFVNGLTSASLDSLLGSEQRSVVDFTLPKFSLETRVDLATVLASMGMATAFDPNLADFSGITTEKPPLYIAKVIHQANIDVVEKGTTAAAVTAVVMAAGATQMQPQKVTFHVDKPFLYFIRDNASGSLLFMGRVTDPTAK